MSRGASSGFPDPDSEESSASGHAWVWRLLYILYSLEVGVFLLFLPWLAIWENNYLLYRFPDFRPVVANSFLRGAELGLGIVNIAIGLQEIGLFRKKTRKRRPDVPMV